MTSPESRQHTVGLAAIRRLQLVKRVSQRMRAGDDRGGQGFAFAVPSEILTNCYVSRAVV